MTNFPSPPSLIQANATVFTNHPAATDANNPLGTVLKPRRTIPNPLPAGTIVDIIGPYATSHTSPNTLIVNGTATAPCVIQGDPETVISSSWEVKGTHLTIQNMRWSASSLTILAPSSFIVVRENDMSGTLTVRGGITVASWDTNTVHDVVLYRNYIHDSGDLNASFDQDFHGIAVGPRVNNLWVLQNHLARCSGDGMQLNGGAGGHSLLHHVYAIDNVSHHNKQTGLWAKQSSDVIFLRNKCYGHLPSNSSSGAQIGGQYGPEHLWIIENEIYDGGGYGVKIASNIGNGTDGQYIMILRNNIYNIHDPGTFDPNNLWHSAGISVSGGKHVYVMENILTNVESGIANTSPAPSQINLYEVGNVITNLGLGGAWTGSHIPANPATIPAMNNYYNTRYEVQ